MNNYKEVFEQIKRYKHISVDIYDTLIFRAVRNPNDIFKIVENILDKELNKKTNFYAKRLIAERRARKNTIREDVSIEEIYKYMKVDDIEKVYFLEKEKEVEIDLTVPNLNLIEILKKVKRSENQIIITTDMYLDKKTIETILDRYEIIYDDIYISGELGVTKKSGNLFSYIVKERNIDTNEIVHIGNDSKTDIESAQNKNWSTIQIFNSISYSNKYVCYSIKDNWNKLITREFIIKSSTMNDDFYNRIGYCCLGPFLVGFCKWIHDSKKGKENLWFVAREGYLIKEVYEILYPEEKKYCNYVRLNKNVLRKPFIYKNAEIEKFLMTIPECKYITFREIISYLQIENDSVKRWEDEEDVNLDFKYSVININDNLEFVKKYEKLIALNFESLKEQTVLLEQYIEEKILNKEHVFLINNSIHGNGQYILDNILKSMNKKIQLVGKQFITSNHCKEKNVDVKGWLHECGISTEKIFLFDRNSLIFEHLLFEHCGTAVELYSTGNGVSIRCKKQTGEKDNEEVIKQLHLEVKKFAHNFVKCNVGKYASISGLAYPMLKFLEYPLLDDVMEISKLNSDDDVSGTKTIIGIERSDIGMSKFNLINLKTSGWRQGYLVACGINKPITKLIGKILYIKSIRDGYYSLNKI